MRHADGGRVRPVTRIFPWGREPAMNGHAFAFRMPWYARERDEFGLNDPRALPPVLQKYESTRFVRQITTDPRDSLEFIDEDKWSYPVPVSFPAPGTGRQRFATSRM